MLFIWLKVDQVTAALRWPHRSKTRCRCFWWPLQVRSRNPASEPGCPWPPAETQKSPETSGCDPSAVLWPQTHGRIGVTTIRGQRPGEIQTTTNFILHFTATDSCWWSLSVTEGKYRPTQYQLKLLLVLNIFFSHSMCFLSVFDITGSFEKFNTDDLSGQTF